MVAGETTPDEILRLIGLLIYFGFFDVKGGGGKVVLEHNNFFPQPLGKIFHVQDAV